MKILTLFLVLFFVTTFCDISETNPTIDEKIGQMLMVGFQGFEVSDTSHIIRDIETFHTGGIILFDYDVPNRSPNRNIDTYEQVQRLISELQSHSDTPLFIAVDQEGGKVARLKTHRDFPRTVSAQYLGKQQGVDSTRIYAAEQSELLNNLGFNVNFAPVVDLNTNPENPVIGQLERSYSADPEIVTHHAEIVIEEHQKQNLLPVIKHFPGHGSAWNDSHVGMADVTDTWEPKELEPYRALIEKPLSFGVMTAHVLNENLDPELPATLSKDIQTGILRDSLQYNGVLFSDDMQMDAIRTFYGLEFSIEKAILAGVDVLVFANNSVYQPDIIPEAVNIIKELINKGVISEERIDQSYQRIINAKKELNLL